MLAEVPRDWDERNLSQCFPALGSIGIGNSRICGKSLSSV